MPTRVRGSTGPIVVLLAAVASGVLATVLDWRLLVPVALGLPLAALAVFATAGTSWWLAPGATTRRLDPGDLDGSTTGQAADETPLLHRGWTLAIVWTALMFATSLRLISGQRSVYAAAEGVLSIDNAIELGVVLVAALIVASALHSGWSIRIAPVAMLFLGFAFLASLSVAWSRLPLFSAARAVEYLVLALFTAYCASRAATEPGFADTLLERILRLTVFGVLGLALYGVAQGGLDLDRFAWRGSNPNTTNAIMLVAIMAVLTHPRRARLTWPLPWPVVPALLVPLVMATGSRIYTAAALLAVAAAWTVAGLRDSRVGAAGVGSGLVVVGLSLLFFTQQITDWVFRNQDEGTVTGLNGRRELWEWVLEHPVGSEIWGVGVGAVRGNLPGHWNPQNAHSSWIDVLQTLGVLGLALLGAFVVAITVLAVLQRNTAATWMVTFVAFASITSVTLSQPSMTLVLLLLAVVLISASRVPSQEVAEAARRGGMAPAVVSGGRQSDTAR